MDLTYTAGYCYPQVQKSQPQSKVGCLYKADLANVKSQYMYKTCVDWSNFDVYLHIFNDVWHDGLISLPTRGQTQGQTQGQIGISTLENCIFPPKVSF